MESLAMESFQQRVVDERSELDVRLSKLADFIDHGITFVNLPDAEQLRMRRQRDAMIQYSAILGERIAAFQIKG